MTFRCRFPRIVPRIPLLWCSLLLLAGCGRRGGSDPTRLLPLKPQDWTQWGGDWRISPYAVENASSDRGVKLVNQTASLEDFALDVDLLGHDPFQEMGILFRSSGEEMGVDSFHGYFAGIRSIDHAVELVRADFGSTILAQRPLSEGADLQKPIHMQLSVVGCNIVLLVRASDGITTRLSASPDPCIRRGHLGFRSSAGAASWTSLHIARPASVEILPSASAGQAPEQKAAPGLPDAPLLRDTDRYVAEIRREIVKHALPQGVQKVSAFRLKRGRYPHVTLEGTVVSPPPFVVIDDGTGSFVLTNEEPGVMLKPGDEVEATGTLLSEAIAVSLQDSHVRVLWSDLPAPPLAVSALQLTTGQYRARLITIQGNLVSKLRLPTTCELILRDQTQLYRAVVGGAALSSACSMDVGSRLRLRGVATSMPRFTQDTYPFAVIVAGIDLLSPPPWWSGRHIAMLGAGLLALALLIQWAVWRVQQWHVQSVLAEREEIAFDMHDTLAQSFTGIAYQLEAAAMESSGLEATREHVKSTLDMVKVSHREVSNAIAALRPQNRDAGSVLSTLRSAAERTSQNGKVRVVTEMTGTPAELPVQVTDAIFRIGQESIVNALRHSQCKQLEIALHFTKRRVRFTVTDDGCGFDGTGNVQGLGLASMRARARGLGATFSIRRGSPLGTVVEVDAPLPLARGPLLYLQRARHLVRHFGRPVDDAQQPPEKKRTHDKGSTYSAPDRR